MGKIFRKGKYPLTPSIHAIPEAIEDEGAKDEGEGNGEVADSDSGAETDKREWEKNRSCVVNESYKHRTAGAARGFCVDSRREDGGQGERCGGDVVERFHAVSAAVPADVVVIDAEGDGIERSVKQAEKKKKSPKEATVGTALKNISARASTAAAIKMKKREAAASRKWVRTERGQWKLRQRQAKVARRAQKLQSR
jgi:hypothetical protein